MPRNPIEEVPLKSKRTRRARKVNNWAKAAGEYYRLHKNDDDIEKFSDVLKSPKFKEYYESKYGKGKKTVTFTESGEEVVSKKATKRMKKGKWNKTKRGNKKVQEEELDEIDESPKEEDKEFMDEKDSAEEEDKMESLEEERENRRRQVKNDYFNGGKKR
jgi:hypothetical protein